MAANSPQSFDAENKRLKSENEKLRLRLAEIERALEAARSNLAESQSRASPGAGNSSSKRPPDQDGSSHIAGRRRAEDAANLEVSQLKKVTEELRAANLQLAEFLAVLSHELRNPLTPIRSSIDILERAAPGGEQARRALAVLDRQTNQLTRLVDDLLDITRIGRGKLRLQRTRVDLVEVVRRSVEDHRAFLEHHEFILELPNEAVPFVGDPTRLVQAIGNVLINATKFTPEGGKITISLTRTVDTAVVEIADSGLGIDSETLKRLFEPFAQAERSLNRSRSGLGLGLALVKGMVELHGGAVRAYSDGPGKGARFTIRLPLDEEPTVGRASPKVKEAIPGKRRVLVIENNVDAAASLRETLEIGDHEVEVAHSGPEGLEKARQFDPDFVICALSLPGMDGYEVARAFRSDQRLKDMHLVAVDSRATREDVERATGAGFDEHVANPSTAESISVLLATVPCRPSKGGQEPVASVRGEAPSPSGKRA